MAHFSFFIDSSKTYSYDGENRMVTAVVSSLTSKYWYDAGGHRVKKIIGGVATRFVYNLAGQLIAEYDEGTSSLTKEYVYKGGALVATVEPTNVVKYATADHLGTPRVWTNSSGAVVTSGRHDYAPFGEELSAGYGVRTTGAAWPSSAQADGQRNQFGSKERDTETGLDFFQARYYGSVQGRFTSTDPVLLTAYRLFNPQGFNLYAYVMNNPLKFVDPDGEEVRFKTEEEAKQAIARIQAGLAKDQRSAVSYEKTKDSRIILKTDAKAAEKAGADSLLGRLNKVATSSLVGQLEFVNQTDKVTIIKFGSKQEKSLSDLGEEASNANTVTTFKAVTLFENTFDRTKKIYFQQVGLNSDTPGVTRILISRQQSTESMTEAIFHETLAHFETAIKGDASGRLTGLNAKHPAINADSAKISNAVQLNLKQK